MLSLRVMTHWLMFLLCVCGKAGGKHGIRMAVRLTAGHVSLIDM
jgi:hypothetical protein